MIMYLLEVKVPRRGEDQGKLEKQAFWKINF